MAKNRLNKTKITPTTNQGRPVFDRYTCARPRSFRPCERHRRRRHRILVDFAPGAVRRAEAAVLDRGMTALEPGNLKVAFVTHLHSGPTVDYADLMFTG